MKKRAILMAICLVFISASLCQALPIYQVKDVVGRYGHGGVFEVVGPGVDILTFCMETNETISLGGKYYGSMDSVLYYGKGIAGKNSFDPIAANTKNLYDYFLDNVSTLTNLQKHQIQIALWAFQGETLLPGDTLVGNDYFAHPGSYIGTDRVIVALNLWTADVGSAPYNNDFDYSKRAQSVLTTAAVPEPSILMLLGLGLIGLAGIRRKI